MTQETEEFLAHYGVKGMKWGRRRASSDSSTSSPSGSGGRSSSGEDSERRKLSPETKRKLKIGAGVVGAAAVIAVGAYAANKQIDANKLKTLAEMRSQVETRRAGEAAARKQLSSANGKAKWKPSTHSKASREGKRQAQAEVKKYDDARSERQKAFAQRTAANRAAKDKRQRQRNSLTSSGREKNRADDLARTRVQINQVAKRSKWEMANSTPSRPKKSTSYSSRDAKKDTKLYGDKGRARIQKRLDNGMTLSGARQREATRQNGIKAARIAMNINSAQRRESKEYDRWRRSRR